MLKCIQVNVLYDIFPVLGVPDHPADYLSHQPLRAFYNSAECPAIALQDPFNKLLFRLSVYAVMVHLLTFDRQSGKMLQCRS